MGQTSWNDDNLYNYHSGDSPFIDYILEDKSHYVHLKDAINPITDRNYIDRDDDFLIGDSGGILMNIDFIFVDTYKFSPAATYYTKYGEYCSYNPDTIEYAAFWARETRRRKAGVIANCKLYHKDICEYFDEKTPQKRRAELLHPVRITGDHYSYLNYGRIERTLNETEREQFDAQGLYKVNTIEGFPEFWDGDYWNFKIDELIGDNGYNLCKAKARRKGFSYKRGHQAANTVNLIKNVTVTLLAYDITYLTGAGKTASMVKTNIEWFENKTYWKRGLLSETLDQIELGYKKSKEGQKKYGFRSKVLSFATKTNPAKAIGGKSIEIDCEEAGKFRNLRMVLGLIRDNMKSGKISVGTLRIYGTGGEKGSDWADFDYIFNNPRAFDMLAMENIWDNNSRHKTCGFFFPYIWCCQPYMDEDGNSLVFSAWKQDKIDDADRKANKSNEDYTIARSQNANSPSEAFVNTTDNIFLSAELVAHIDNLKNDNKYKFYNDGWYLIKGNDVVFYNREECRINRIFPTSKYGFHDYISTVPHQANTDIHGCIREYYPPFTIDNVVPDNLYFISVDPYRVDKHQTEVTVKHSLYSFKVWTKQHPASPYRKGTIVAEYTGRLNTMADNDWILFLACRRWNAKALIEAGTGETVSNFRKWKALNYLALDPTSIISRNLVTSKRAIGIVIGDEEKKMDGLNSLRDFIYEVIGYDEDNNPILRLSTIYSLSFCLELLNFNATGNFDRISDAIVAMFEFRKDAILAVGKYTDDKQGYNKRLDKNSIKYNIKNVLV